MLPSEALDRASTLDLRVLEISTKWNVRRERLQSEPEKVHQEDYTREFGTDQLQDMMNSARGIDNANNKEHNGEEPKQDDSEVS